MRVFRTSVFVASDAGHAQLDQLALKIEHHDILVLLLFRQAHSQISAYSNVVLAFR